MANFNLVTKQELEDALTEIKRSIQEWKDLDKGKMDLPEYLTTAETAKLLKVSEFTIREWTKKGYLVRYLISSRYRYKTKEVIDSPKRIGGPNRSGK